MPVLRVYQHGLTAGIPPGDNNHVRAKRGECEGWTHSSTRSNTRFLYSVHEPQLTGQGFAITLTLRDCPGSHDDWNKLRRAYFERLRRMGLIRAHWLTEWQRRGVPHLHCAIWLPEPQTCSERLLGDYRGSNSRITHYGSSELFRLQVDLVDHWLSLAGPLGALPHSQTVEPIHNSVGWFKYLSKHASRGLSHYQRSSAGIPEGWRKTGRMWGHLGEWPTREAIRLELDNAGFFAFRRIVRNYRIADARADGQASGKWRRLSQARRMLNCNDRKLATVRGISEWIELETQLQITAHLAAMGYQVHN